jgi:hypothetical protein
MPLLAGSCALVSSLSDSMLADLTDPNIEKMLLYLAQCIAELCSKTAKTSTIQVSAEQLRQLGECCMQCLLRGSVFIKVQAAVSDNTNKKKLVLYLFETVFFWTMRVEFSSDLDVDFVATVRAQLFVSLISNPHATAVSRIVELVGICSILLKCSSDILTCL